MSYQRAVLFSTVSLAVVLTGGFANAATCDSLKGQQLPHATIVAAESVAAGKLTLPNADAPLADAPAFCRVVGISRPTADSEIEFQIWIPEGAAWNGKFAQMGNGGFAGAVPAQNMSLMLRRGYAVAGTDNGHKGSVRDADWALGHPEKIVDFGYRSLKETTDKGKALLKALTGKDPKRSYFVGCSDGGREALMEAMRYPEDFDGIIAGAPANFWTHQFAGFVWNQQAMLKNEEAHIPPGNVYVISTAARAQCGGKDGGLANDPFLNDPRDCKFDPVSVQCKPGQVSAACLNPSQVAAAKAIYGGLSHPKTGAQLFPGYPPGGESFAGNWQSWIVGEEPRKGAQYAFGGNYYQYMVRGQAKDFDIHSIDFDTDVAKADAIHAKVLNSTNPDLSPFKARGGKMIQYIGWDDTAVSAYSSINYYNSVALEMHKGADPAAALKQVQAFYRMFLVPGMAHCSGGEGANSFGNGSFGLTAADKVFRTPEHDIVAALDKWVEEDIAPEQLIATKFKDEDPKNGVAFQRPLCLYPKASSYKGSGNPKVASSWACDDDAEGFKSDLTGAAKFLEDNKAVLYNPPIPNK